MTVIPRFAVLLQSLNKPLPRRTELLIQISSWINSIHYSRCGRWYCLSADPAMDEYAGKASGYHGCMVVCMCRMYVCGLRMQRLFPFLEH